MSTEHIINFEEGKWGTRQRAVSQSPFVHRGDPVKIGEEEVELYQPEQTLPFPPISPMMLLRVTTLHDTLAHSTEDPCSVGEVQRSMGQHGLNPKEDVRQIKWSIILPLFPFAWYKVNNPPQGVHPSPLRVVEVVMRLCVQDHHTRQQRH